MGDDWAEDHHDVEIVDEHGKVLARRRLPEGLAGVTRLHTLLGEHAPPEWADLDPASAAAQVVVGIETDRGPWVGALVAAGYTVYGLNPMSVARYRERYSTSGAKSDTADAHLLAEIVRLDRAHHRPVAGDSATGEAVKVSARAHQSLIWDRTRHVLRLRSALREFFPAAMRAFEGLDAPEALQLLALAPDPDTAARLSRAKIVRALTAANRRDVTTRAETIREVLTAPELRRPAPVQDAYAAVVASEVALITVLNTQIERLGQVVDEHFGRHRDADIYTSLPGLGVILSARILGEFGDDPDRYADATCRKAYAGTAPITRASGTRSGPGQVRPQPAPRRRRPAVGLLLHARIARCPRLLPVIACPRHRSPNRAPPARQPLGRHPPRLPPAPHLL
ncbi:IS110 family transposase [Ornithinimicrobium pekingense]|uniref:IS110 family transposase n=1 Tax=Ornithinimicrobium pekingense TaxID=384677 RepID=UPI001E61BDFA|nr:IS110 family transposase [Ornithinimicrobium pekingense]